MCISGSDGEPARIAAPLRERVGYLALLEVGCGAFKRSFEFRRGGRVV